MTKKIYELLDQPRLYCENDNTVPELPYPVHTGVEIEAEGVNDGAEWLYEQTLWRGVGDGSLRNNGMEFVFHGPLSPDKAVQALRLFAERGGKYDYSKRTSVHVHVNVRDISSPALLRFLVLYLIFERVLYARFGAERYASNFCVPAHTNEALLNLLAQLDHGRVVHQLMRSTAVRTDYKYGGVNLSSLPRFGTVEFRFCRGTHEYEELLLLLKTLTAMRQYAVTNTKLARYIDDASDGNTTGLLYRVFPRDIVEQLGTPAQLFALSVDGARVVERVLHSKELDAVAADIMRKAGAAGIAPTPAAQPEEGPVEDAPRMVRANPYYGANYRANPAALNEEMFALMRGNGRITGEAAE